LLALLCFVDGYHGGTIHVLKILFTLNRVPVAENKIHHDLEKLLKLAIPNIAVWLVMFYTVFHLALNILAEALCFGDRLFYLDWWNCTSMDFFWRTWNLPVHKWMVVHVYIPMLEKGFAPAFSSFMVFFVSAIGHEVIISIPFRTWKFWAFSAMMAQMPLCLVNHSLLNLY
jgi:diacylglycerol O-acyltransferase 1